MTRKVYVMNELLFENLNKFLQALEDNNVTKPYYSVTDDGQLVSLTWDSNRVGKSVIGSMQNKQVTFTCYIDDIYETRAIFALPHKIVEAVRFVGEFYK